MLTLLTNGRFASSFDDVDLTRPADMPPESRIVAYVVSLNTDTSAGNLRSCYTMKY